MALSISGLKTKRERITTQLATLEADAEARVKALTESHETRIEGIQKEHEARVEKLNNDFAEKVGKVSVTARKAKLEKDLEETNTALQTELEVLQKQIEEIRGVTDAIPKVEVAEDESATNEEENTAEEGDLV